MKPNLAVCGPVSSRSGYGDRTRDIVKSLILMDKFNVQILDQKWGNSPRDAMPKDFLPMVIPNLTIKPDVWVMVSTPNEFQAVGNFNIGITAGIGSDRCSPQWIQGINKMNLVIVPSEHIKTTFQNSQYQTKNDQTQQITGTLQVSTKIEVLPSGLDMEVFNDLEDHPESIISSLDSIPEKDCYLVVGKWKPGEFGHDQKDLGGTIRTFLETFKNKSKKNQPAMVIKTSMDSFSIMSREEILTRIRDIRASVKTSGQVPKVYLLYGDLTQKEMNGLYHHKKIKAMISFSHAESYGKSLLEFGITGKPILAPKWSGHLDFLSKNGTMLQGKITPIHGSALLDEVLIEGSSWYYVDYGYAMGIIKDLHSNYKKYLSKSRKQKQHIKDNFTFEKMTELFTKQLEDNGPSFDIKLPKLEELETYG